MYVAAFLMGITGGLHCLGMCGPLVMSATGRATFSYARFVYAAGRVITYALLGALVGGMGHLIQLTQYQQTVSMVMGGAILLIGLASLGGVRIPTLSNGIYPLLAWLKRIFSAALGRKGKRTIFLLGMLNGLLPCGLTYLSLAYCITLERAWEGATFMLVFGMATMPLMVGGFWVLHRIWRGRAIPHQAVVNSVLLIVSGAILIIRAYIKHCHGS